MLLLINMDDDNYKDACFILSEYLTLYYKYKAIYGEQCVVLYQNGKFFEFYGVDNEEEKLGNTKEMSKLLGLQLARRNSAILENNRKNFLMVGFPTYQIDRYVNILLEEKYTCVIVEQDDSVTSSVGGRKTRKVTGIVGPSTDIKYSVTCNNNYLVCLYVQKESQSLINSSKANKINFVNISVAMTSIDVSTGEIICYECHNTCYDENIVYDETNRFITTMNPSEILIYIDDDISNVFLSNIIIDGLLCHVKKMTDINKSFYKLSFQNQYLKKIYKNCGLLEPIEFIGMERSPTLIIVLILIVEFCYNQNENIINNLEVPQIWNYKKYLNLDNTTLSQLNIIEKNEDCILTIMNKTSTPMGKRYLRNRLSLPYIDEERLNESYNIIEDMMKPSTSSTSSTSTSYEYEKCENLLKDIGDIEKIQRKISLGIATLDEFSTLQSSYKSINKLFDVTKSYRHSFEEIDEMREYINYAVSFIKQKNEINVINVGKGIDIFNVYCIFKKGIYNDLDDLELKIKTRCEKLESFICTMSKLISNVQTDDLITLKTDKENNVVYITCTSKRWDMIIKNHKTIILNDNKIEAKDWYKIAGKETKDVKMTCNVLISFMEELEDLKSEMFRLNTLYFKNFLTPLWDKYSYLMSLLTQFVSEIDYYKSCAKCAIQYNYCKPVINTSSSTPVSTSPSPSTSPSTSTSTYNDDSYVISKGLRHALIERLQTKVQYVPQDVDLLEERQLLLFGVNCSGKSSYMRAIGVSVIMAQAGMFVPATSFMYRPYKTILTRIVGNDDIRHGKSTFSVEMGELRSIIKRANKNSLILGDEICHGTESTSAVSILSSSLYYLDKLNCNAVFTTHLHPVINISHIDKLYKEKRLGIYHFKVVNDNGILLYDRKLEKGSGSSLYGLEVAKAMNFPPEFISLANDIRKELLEINPILESHRSKYNKHLYLDKCEVCEEKAVDTHHIKFQSCADDNGYIGHIHKDHMSNLVALCKKCHQKVHASKPTLKINGYIQQSTGVKLDYVLINV